MIFTTKILLLGFVASSLGLGGYKYYEYWLKEREYEKLYKIFEEYDYKKVIWEFDDDKNFSDFSSNRLKDEFEPFRVIHFESLSEIELP